MDPNALGSSFSAPLSQASPLAWSCLSPSAHHGQTSPPAPSSAFASTLTVPPLYPQLSHTNSLTKLPLFSETLLTPFSSELVRTCPFKIKNPEANPLISYTPWTKNEL